MEKKRKIKKNKWEKKNVHIFINLNVFPKYKLI
jgi:hypothetical protein